MEFPTTRRSAVFGTRSGDLDERTRAFEILVGAYWKPVYKYVRLKWGASSEDAQDLTQGFFARAIEKGFFAGYDPGRASFRTYLRTCLDGFVANEKTAERRIKRGGEAEIVSLDFVGVEGELRRYEIPDGMTMEEYFRNEWVRSLFGLAVESLREECESRGKGVHFRLFERCDLDGERLTYEQFAAEFGLSTSNVTNYLAYARREFRRIVLEKLRETTGNEREFQSEARLLLGIVAS